MLPESVIVETTEYKCLQSQFSVLYNESMQIKTQLDETRTMLTNSKNTHLRQIEQMEVSFCVLLYSAVAECEFLLLNLDMGRHKLTILVVVNHSDCYNWE